MEKIYVAVSNYRKPKFSYTCGEFPISDRTLLACLKNPKEVEKVACAARYLMGVPEDASVVVKMYCPMPGRNDNTFDDFIFDLECAYRAARGNLTRNQQQAVFLMPSAI